MSLVLLLVVLAVIGAIAVVAAGRGGGLGEAEPDRSPRGALPDGEVTAQAVDGLRFSLAFRGYRMDEVDGVLDRLGAELERRRRRISELEGLLAEPAGRDARPGAPEGPEPRPAQEF